MEDGDERVDFLEPAPGCDVPNMSKHFDLVEMYNCRRLTFDKKVLRAFDVTLDVLRQQTFLGEEIGVITIDQWEDSEQFKPHVAKDSHRPWPHCPMQYRRHLSGLWLSRAASAGLRDIQFL